MIKLLMKIAIVILMMLLIVILIVVSSNIMIEKLELSAILQR